MDDTTKNELAGAAALPSDEIETTAAAQTDAQPQGDTAFTQPFERSGQKITLKKAESVPPASPQPIPQYYQPQPMAHNYQQQPMPQYYQPQPMARQYQQQPMPQYYQPQPMARQYQQQPMPQYYQPQPMPQYAHPYGASISGYTNAYPQYPVYRKTPQEAEREALHKASSSAGGLTIAVGITMIGVAVIVMIAAVLTGVFSSNVESLEGDPYLGFTPMGFYLYEGITSLASMFIPALIVMAGVRKEQRLRTDEILPFTPIGGQKLALIVFAGCGVCMVAQIMSSLYSSLLGLFGFDIEAALDMALGTSPLDILMNCIGTALIPALVEEFAFRGVVLGALKKYDVRIAIIGSAFLFGILHGNFAQIPFAFMLGLMFGYVRVKTDSMLPSILMHFANNFYAVILMTAAKALPDTVSGILDISVIIVFSAVGFVCLYLLAKNHKDFFRLEIRDTYLPYSEKLSTFFTTGTVIATMILAAIESFAVLTITL